MLKKLAESGKIHPDETTVAYITGNGLKTAEAVNNVIGAPLRIDARLDSFNQAWAKASGQPQVADMAPTT